MKKILLNLFLIVVFIFLFSGCTSNNTNKINMGSSDDKNGKSINEKITLDNIKSKIEQLGIDITEDEPFYQMVGAEAGIKLYSGESRVEIYKFDKTSDAYKIAESNQKLSLGDGYEFDAVVKNGYAYIIDFKFPNYDKVISLLNRLE